MRNVLFGAGIAGTLVGLAVTSTSIGWGCLITVVCFCLAAVCDADRSNEINEPKRDTWFEDGMIQ